MKKLLNPNFIKNFQRIVVIAAFLSAILLIPYALGFSSDIFPLYYLSDPRSKYVSGSEIYAELQPFNRTLLQLAIIGLIISVSMFVFFAQKRRIYYLSNYITLSVVGLYQLAMAIVLFVKLPSALAMFSKIDFETYERIATTEWTHVRYVDTPTAFYLGLVLATVFVLVALALAALMVLKYLARKNELAQIRATEAANG